MYSNSKNNGGNNNGNNGNKKDKNNEVRDVQLPLRIIKEEETKKTVAVVAWNTFYWRDTLKQMGLPGSAYVEFDQLVNEYGIFRKEDVIKYLNTNDPDPKLYSSLVSLFYFSNEELEKWNLTKQMRGFLFVSMVGLSEVDSEKWNVGALESLQAKSDGALTKEMDLSSKAIQEYLQHQCAASMREQSNIEHMGKRARYHLQKSVRYLPTGTMGLLERVLNVAREVHRRPEYTGKVKPIECIAEIV